MGSKKNAPVRAAEIANQGAQQGIDELRRQFDVTQANIQPFVDAGAGALPLVQEGTTAEGLDARLGRIFDTDIFGSLVDERERAARGQLAAGGLTRSGTALEEIANIPTQLGLALEDLLTGRATGLAGSGQNAAAGLGALGAQNSGSIANLFEQQGQNTASGILGKAQAQSAGLGQVLKLASGIFFSDPRLKENVESIGAIGNLTLVQWDWKDFCKDTIIEDCYTIGFMADEVEAKYPHHVGEFGGWKALNYPALLDELETKYMKAA